MIAKLRHMGRGAAGPAVLLSLALIITPTSSLAAAPAGGDQSPAYVGGDLRGALGLTRPARVRLSVAAPTRLSRMVHARRVRIRVTLDEPALVVVTATLQPVTRRGQRRLRAARLRTRRLLFLAAPSQTVSFPLSAGLRRSLRTRGAGRLVVRATATNAYGKMGRTTLRRTLRR